MRLRKAVEGLWKISSAAACFATGKTVPSLHQALARPGKASYREALGIISSLLTVGYICLSKNDGADSDNHRQIRGRVYTRVSVSNLRFLDQPRRFRMALQAHLVE